MNRNYFLSILLLMYWSINSMAQAPNISWEKQSNNRGTDFYSDVIEDLNDGYTVLGSKTTNENSLDLWIIRMNGNGDTIWTETLGTEHKDLPKKITQLSDKSYVVLGVTQKEDSLIPLLIKLGENGTEQWRKTFEGNEFIVIEDVISLEENRIALAGGKGTDSENIKIWMAVLGLKGEIIWEKIVQEDRQACAKSIKRLPSGGFAIAGQTSERGKKDCDIIALRTTEQGALKWLTRIKTPNEKVWPECICCSKDSCFMLVGWKGKCLNDINSDDPIFDFDMVLNKIDCEGKILWTKNYDREGSEGGDAVTFRPDGSFIVAGIKATSFLGKVGPWLLQVDAQGNELGEKLLKFRFNNDHAAQIINCADGGFVVIGPGLQDATNTRSDGWIMKFTSF